MLFCFDSLLLDIRNFIPFHSVGQKRVTTKSCFTYNSFDNILSSAEIEKGIKKRLWKESGYIKFGVISLVKKIVRKLRRMLTVNN